MPHELSRGRLAFVTLLIALLAMIGPFTIDTMFPAFDLIGADVGADAVAMQQVTSVYMLAFAAMSLWHGPISDAVGRRPVILTGLVIYLAASVLCAFAPSLPVLLAGRALQGLAAGAAQIISRTVIRDLHAGPAAQHEVEPIDQQDRERDRGEGGAVEGNHLRQIVMVSPFRTRTNVRPFIPAMALSSMAFWAWRLIP